MHRPSSGYDAGAHTGPIGTYSLVPQIVDAAGDWAFLYSSSIFARGVLVSGEAGGVTQLAVLRV